MAEEGKRPEKIRDIAVITKVLENLSDDVIETKEEIKKDKCKECNVKWFQKVLYLIIGSLITGIGYVGVKYLEFVLKK